MADVDQDFNVFQGDDVGPIFTVTNSAGTAIDLSGFTVIQWIAYLDPASSPSLSLLRSAGGISFATNGTDGKIQLVITKTASAALTPGWYYHSVVVSDGTGLRTTVAIGRMAVLQRGALS